MQNPKDPLKNSAPPRAEQLFNELSKVCNGFSAEEVAGAGINLLLNALRQTHATRDRAEKGFDEMTGRAKALLLEKHYHGDGSRRNIFPHTQVVEVGPPNWSKNTFMRS